MPRRKKNQVEEPEVAPVEPAPLEDYTEALEPYDDADYYGEEAVEEYVEEEPQAVAQEVAAESAYLPEEGYEEEEEEAAYRYETRQEVLARLMRRLLAARERVREALERVRDLNCQARDAGPRVPEKLREQYQRAVAELSAARREENLARSELIQMLSWRG
ncbi:MAG TPA: hypothetical protein VNM72_01760 [Blastocatellia bacterium]|nr:hypothetical protein [Blastocatellia bacterium]